MDLDPAIAAAIGHAVKAGACWTALRCEPHRTLWGYLARANSRRAAEALEEVSCRAAQQAVDE